MIPEEYPFELMTDYLNANVGVLITGFTDGLDKSHRKMYVPSRICVPKTIMFTVANIDQSIFSLKAGDEEVSVQFKDVTNILRKHISRDDFVLMDITSLDHTSIMTLTRSLFFLNPRILFASYVLPKQYSKELGSYAFSSPGSFREVKGFISHKPHDKLYAFIGFEAVRLGPIIDNYSDISCVIGFPSENPRWKSEALVHIVCDLGIDTIAKTDSHSVFHTLDFLEKELEAYPEGFDLAPLGTRPHTLACAIFAYCNSKCSLIYDRPVEKSYYSEKGAAIIYNLSNLIPVKEPRINRSKSEDIVFCNHTGSC